MLKSLEQARLGFSLRLSWTAIGPDINAKFLEELGAIGDVLKLGEAIPLPINELISANPETITVPTMTSAAQTTDVAIDLASIPESQRQGASFTLDNSNVGFELKQLAGKLQLKRLTASDTGATIRINCSARAAASAQNQTPLTAHFDVAVQSVKRIPDVGSRSCCELTSGAPITRISVAHQKTFG